MLNITNIMQEIYSSPILCLQLGIYAGMALGFCVTMIVFKLMGEDNEQ